MRVRVMGSSHLAVHQGICKGSYRARCCEWRVHQSSGGYHLARVKREHAAL